MIEQFSGADIFAFAGFLYDSSIPQSRPPLLSRAAPNRPSCRLARRRAVNAPGMLPFRPDFRLAASLFAELRQRTGCGGGITRASYGEGEAAAHAIVAREARLMGMRVVTDAALNLFMTLPGRRREPRIMIGSHLDSVPSGGNYDGAAGVIMGLSVAAGMQKAAVRPPFDQGSRGF